ncbi:DUF5702 domain-containing protein [Eubacterium xylanophilum]|uniref:DUF5702 domain-containing protein n=1 Tax=Eubacterium xylanophilum TaxID=39497 RepID=UPI0004797657|nr:DUF5702 domain-containing protein [Eubacterium xylanophilum]
MHYDRNDGSVTVLFSLVLLIIVALIGTVLEITRTKMCEIHSYRTLVSSADSLLTEYSRPLYDRYNLFFIEDCGKSFERSIAEYAAPAMGQREISPLILLPYCSGILTDVSVTNKRYIGNNDCESLMHQISELSKRKLVESFLTKIAGKKEELIRSEEDLDNLNSEVEENKKLVKDYERAVKEVIISDIDKYIEKIHLVRVRRDFGKRLEKASEGCKKLRKGSYKKIVEVNLSVINETRDILGSMETAGDLEKNTEYIKSVRGRLKELWKRYNSDLLPERGEEQMDNPMENVKEATDKGLLKLVLPEGEDVSKKKTEEADRYHDLYVGQSQILHSQQRATDRIEDFLEEKDTDLSERVGESLNDGAESLYLLNYINKYFSCFAGKKTVKRKDHTKEKTALDYEMEYLVAGEKSDKANLEEVVGKILLIRTAVNTSALIASSAKRETAHTAALAIVGFTGIEPLVIATQFTLLALWGMVEGMVDVCAILQGRSVPLIKRENDIKVTFPELFTVSRAMINNKARQFVQSKGGNAASVVVDYSQYLSMLMLMNGQTRTLHRMMDVMEQNIRKNEVKDFNLSICADAFDVDGIFSYETKFIRLPGVRNVIDSKLKFYSIKKHIGVSYVK